jgi:broad specificity phosphatase PhoE
VDPSILQVTELIREHSFGIREGLPKGTSVLEARAVVAEKLGVPESEVIDTAETIDNILARQKTFIELLRSHAADLAKRKWSSCSTRNEPVTLNVFCVSHGAFILSFLRNIVGIESGKIKNCSVSIVELDIDSCLDNDSDVRISGNLNFINSVSHLSPESSSMKFSLPSSL